MSYARGIADSVRVLESIARQLEGRPLLSDVEALGHNPFKRRALADLFLFAAEQMAELARPIPKSERGDDGAVFDGRRAADAARSQGDEEIARD